MSRTFRNIPFKLPCWIWEIDKIHRDGVSSKSSPNKEYKRHFNQSFRTKQKRNLRDGKPFDVNKKEHIWRWW